MADPRNKTTVVPFPRPRRHDTDADFVEACAGYVRALQPMQEAHGISREDLDRLVRIARRGIA